MKPSFNIIKIYFPLSFLDNTTLSQVSSAIDKISTNIFNALDKDEGMDKASIPDNDNWVVSYYQQLPQALPYLLVALLHIVVFEESTVQWSLSRPFLTLILLHRQVNGN